jgi:diketogulonate reductase-like aldo/keto reductase
MSLFATDDAASACALPRLQLGSTSMNVTQLGLGGAAFGGVFGDVELDECIATVHEAVLEHGINFIDTSPYYGDSETVLGHCLKGLPRDKYFIATKCGRYGDDDFDFSASRVCQSVSDSIEKVLWHSTYAHLSLRALLAAAGKLTSHCAHPTRNAHSLASATWT